MTSGRDADRVPDDLAAGRAPRRPRPAADAPPTTPRRMTRASRRDGEPVTVSITLPTVEHTLALGRAIGRHLRAGDLVILTGSLGAGKTALTKGIGAGMGVAGTVMSPTFVIARVHAGDPPLVHVDAYRLTGTVELDDLDLDTDLGRGAVVVEWGEGVAEQLTEQRLIVALERLPDDTRIARLTPVGTDWVDRLHALIDTVTTRRRPRRPQLAGAPAGADQRRWRGSPWPVVGRM